ncbi:four helix bundle protein [Patescibacteria group bacterium]|nr:MAG: four helix bundle protein [Patescibacteria group bacterium]
MNNEKTGSYQDLIVWQKAMDLVVGVYEITKDFPTDERYGIVSQMRRSAVSIPSNIAEGYRRKSEVDFQRFLRIAYGSASELETQLLIAQRLRYGPASFARTDALLEEILKMLNKMTEGKSS